MVSSPLRAIPLLSISSPCRGNIFSGTGSAQGDGSSKRLSFEKKPDCGFDDFIHVLEFYEYFNICVV